MKTKIIKINPKELKLLELNARYMKNEEFRRLVENVKNDGALTSVPFACKDDDGKYLVLSGNHRTKAAVEAGLKEITIMVTEEPLTEQQRVAIQLSHNAIVGEDDPAILKQLYEMIDDIDLKIYSGLDDKTLELLSKVQPVSLNEANLEFQSLNIVFLPHEIEQAQRTWDEIRDLFKGTPVWLTSMAAYDKWLDSLEEISSAHGVKNVATAMLLMMKIYENHKTDLQEGYLQDEGTLKHKAWVPIASITGNDKVPAATALKLKKIAEDLTSRKDGSVNLLDALADAYRVKEPLELK